MLYISVYLPVLYYHGKLQVTKGAYTGGRGFPLPQQSFLFCFFFVFVFFRSVSSVQTAQVVSQILWM